MNKDSASLRAARKAAGLTILELAERAGLTWGVVQSIEVGRYVGKLSAKFALADALGSILRDIFPETYAEICRLMATPGWTKKRLSAKEKRMSKCPAGGTFQTGRQPKRRLERTP